MRADLKEMEESLSGALPDEMKKPMREGIKKLKADIASLEKQEAEEADKAVKEKADQAKREKAAQAKKEVEAKQKAEAAKKEKAEKEAKKKKGKVTAANAKDCEQLVSDLRKELNAFMAEQAPKSKKKRTKKSSATVATGIVRPIQSIARREMTAEKVSKIRVDKLREAREHFAKGLQQIKLAFGGINDSNSTILKNFQKEMNALIKEIETKQKDQKAA